MAVEVMMMSVAVPMAMAVTVAMSVAMASGESRAIDGQRGRAQRENSKRRHNELLILVMVFLPICAARGSPCCDRKLRLARCHAM